MQGEIGHATVGVLTIVDAEFEAAKNAMELADNVLGTRYFVGAENEQQQYGVVLVQAAGRANGSAQGATRDLIEDFRPHFLLLVGIAGGIDPDILGDVVLADYIEYYEFLKILEGEELTRRDPYDQPSEYLRVDVARPRRQAADWLDANLVGQRPIQQGSEKDSPDVREENIAVGEKLLADKDSALQRQILQRLKHCKAVDMESYGFMKALYSARRSIHYNPMGLVVRGISDLVNAPENDEMRKQWRPYAARVAAVFARAVIRQLLATYPPQACCDQGATSQAAIP